MSLRLRSWGYLRPRETGERSDGASGLIQAAAHAGQVRKDGSTGEVPETVFCSPFLVSFENQTSPIFRDLMMPRKKDVSLHTVSFSSAKLYTDLH